MKILKSDVMILEEDNEDGCKVQPKFMSHDDAK